MKKIIDHYWIWLDENQRKNANSVIKFKNIFFGVVLMRLKHSRNLSSSSRFVCEWGYYGVNFYIEIKEFS